MSKLVASVSIAAGLVTAVLTVLVAFGVHITADQHTAIEGVVGAVLAIAGLFFHPSVPIGPTKT